METPIRTSDQNLLFLEDVAPAHTGEVVTKSSPAETDTTAVSASPTAGGVAPTPAPPENSAASSRTPNQDGAKTAKVKPAKKSAASPKGATTTQPDQRDVATPGVAEALDNVAKKKDVASGSVPSVVVEVDEMPFSPLTMSTMVEMLSALDLEIKRFEEMATRSPLRSDRERMEICWLFLMCNAFKGLIRLFGVRKGFLLLFLKATAPTGHYQKQVAALYPGWDERTCRYYVQQARLFLKAVGFELNENGDAAYFTNLRDTWTISAIVAAMKAASVASTPAVEKLGAGCPAEKSESVKKPQPAYVRLDTLRQHCIRSGKATDKLLDSVKRVAPTDVEKAASHIEKYTPEKVRFLYLEELAVRKAALAMETDLTMNI